MEAKTAVISFIVLLFISNLYILLDALSTDKKQAILTTSETITIANISSNLDNSDTAAEDSQITSNIEPSIDIKIKEGNEETFSNNDDISETLTKAFEFPNNEAVGNDSPITVTSETSTEELHSVADISLVLTNEQIAPKISTQDENIPENISVLSINNSEFQDIPKEVFIDKVVEVRTDEKNVSGDANEDIPSFSEWAQKRLEEVEKNEQINSSAKGSTSNGKGQNAKHRWKNYASLDCGAKVVAANPESVSPGAILSPSTDEYKLNPCTSRIWFVVELCEAIQIKKIDLANYELFSSSPKEFTVSVSDRYPTRDWSFVGKFTAKDERDIQSFDLDTHLFGKYVKVEIKSHYGSEHYCPISLFRAYGTSVFEVLQKEDPAHVNRVEDEDDDEDDSLAPSDDQQKNLFSSATDAVISMVKRAADVFGNKVNNQTRDVKLNGTDLLRNTCSSPRHVITCNNCNESFFSKIYELISCKTSVIQNLVSIPHIYNKLVGSYICQKYGISLKNNLTSENSYSDDLELFFPITYIIAMCNEVAILENQAVLNTSQQYLNLTKDLTKEKVINLDVGIPEIVKEEKLNETVIDSLLIVDNKTSKENTPEIENTSYTAQIKPTKVFDSKPDAEETASSSAIRQPDVLTFETVTDKVDIPTPLTESMTEATTSSNVPTTSNEVESVTEPTDSMEDHLEHIISDWNAESQSTTPSTTATTTNSPQAPKESIFLRLSNRIKTLERNMSLSGQYLEELSKRYKKQVEEMQHLLEKTIATLREEGLRRDERNRLLEERLDSLTTSMELLMAERQFLRSMLYLIITIILVSYGIYFFCGKPSSGFSSTNEKTGEVFRRGSVDILSQKPLEKKKRRPSDQALKIVRHSSLIEDEKIRRPKKRKKNNIKRSNSANGVNKMVKNVEAKNSRDWVEENNQIIENIPFALEESDLSLIEDYPLPNDRKSESPQIENLDASQCYFEISKSKVPDKVKSTDEYSLKSNSNSTSTVTSLNEPIRKEKKGLKKLFKKVF